MFLIKGYLVHFYESIMIDANTEEEAIKIYSEKFEEGELEEYNQDLDLEIMQIDCENEKESNG